MEETSSSSHQAVLATQQSTFPAQRGEWFNYRETPRAIRKCGNSHSQHPQVSILQVQLRIPKTKHGRMRGGNANARGKSTRTPALQTLRHMDNHCHQQKEFATRTPQSTVCFLDLLNPSSLLLKILDSATGAKPREQPVSMCGGSTSPHMST